MTIRTAAYAAAASFSGLAGLPAASAMAGIRLRVHAFLAASHEIAALKLAIALNAFLIRGTGIQACAAVIIILEHGPASAITFERILTTFRCFVRTAHAFLARLVLPADIAARAAVFVIG